RADRPSPVKNPEELFLLVVRVFLLRHRGTSSVRCCDDCWNPSRPMLRDIRQPDPVRDVGTEDALDVVVEHGRAGLLALPPPPALRGREDPGLRAQFPRRSPAHPPPGPSG